MKIKKVKINGYGKLVNKSYDFCDGINVIYGKNEQGKSTLLNFIESSFFGISKSKVRKTSKTSFEQLADSEKYLPLIGNDFSGSVDYVLNGEEFTVFNDFAKKKCVVYDGDKQDISKQFSNSKSTGNMFFTEQVGLDRELFENSFLVSQGKNVLDGESSRSLLQKISNIASTGEENNSYFEIKKKIEKQISEEIGTSRTAKRPVNILTSQIESLEKSIEELQSYDKIKYELEDTLEQLEYKLEFYNKVLEVIKDFEGKKQSVSNGLSKIEFNSNLISQNLEQKDEMLNSIENFEKQLQQVENKKKEYEIEVEEKEDKLNLKVEKKKASVKKINIGVWILGIVLNIILFFVVKFLSFGVYVLPVVVTLFNYLSLNKVKKQVKLELENVQSGEGFEEFDTKIAELRNSISLLDNKIDLLEQQIAELEKENLTLSDKDKVFIENIEEDFRNVLTDLISEYFDVSDFEKEQYISKFLNSSSSDVKDYINKYELEKHKILFNKKENEPKLDKLLNMIETKAIYEGNLKVLKEKETTLELAKNILDKSYLELKKKISPKFSQNLSDLIFKITDGKYSQTKFVEDQGFAVLDSTGQFVSSSYLSQGMIDQLYISLRLSMIDDFSNYSVPIFLDEAFAYYDNERLRNVLKFISSSFDNRQVFIFTCSDREENILEDLGVRFKKIEI